MNHFWNVCIFEREQLHIGCAVWAFESTFHLPMHSVSIPLLDCHRFRMLSHFLNVPKLIVALSWLLAVTELRTYNFTITFWSIFNHQINALGVNFRNLSNKWISCFLLDVFTNESDKQHVSFSRKEICVSTEMNSNQHSSNWKWLWKKCVSQKEYHRLSYDNKQRLRRRQAYGDWNVSFKRDIA